MRLKDLARDITLVPRRLNRIERSMRCGFITIRVRLFRAGMPGDPTIIPDTDVPSLKTYLAEEITKVAVAYNTIRSLVDEAEAAGNWLNLNNIDRRIINRYKALGNPQKIRQRLIKSSVWWACAADASLQDLANIDDLYLLIHRRVHIVERMLYDVGAGGGRAWKAKAIFNNPGGDWEDGWNRMFEYPRVLKRVGSSGMRRRIFREKCMPSQTGYHLCTNDAMDQWHENSIKHINLRDTTWHPRIPMRIRLNSSARKLWEPDPIIIWDDYAFHLKSGSDPVLAIEKLFERRASYKDRNLLFCDHAIHVLHMESLLWTKKKRNPETKWLTSYISSPRKLRIDIPFWKGGGQFLGGWNDGVYFENQTIHAGTVQIGDHLIVYNHPAYDKVNSQGVWRLENAIVVQVYPKILLQGHGTKPLTIGQMKQEMIKLFNQALRRLRRKVVENLSPSVTEIPLPGDGKIVRRVAPASSDYSNAKRRADWWVKWPHDTKKDENNIAADPARRELVKQIHKIEYDATHGYFPLWEPQLRKNGNPIRNIAGKISKIKPVVISADMVAAWTWYMPQTPALRRDTPVIRPRV